MNAKFLNNFSDHLKYVNIGNNFNIILYMELNGIYFVCRDNPRDARNKAEKQRRDKLNGSINELASLVPLVAESSRKIDKTGVLRLTAHDLRKEHGEPTDKQTNLSTVSIHIIAS